MKTNETRRAGAITVLLASTALAVSIKAGAHGNDHDDFPDSNWSKAVAETAINTPAAEGCPIETADGLSLLFASTRPGGVPGNAANDIWVADRDSLTSPWKPAKNLGEPINSIASDFCPTPVGRSLFFVSERLDNGTPTPVCGGGDMYLSRQSPAGDWSTPRMLGCAPDGPNFSGPERSPSLVETDFGTFLFYSSNGGSGDQDIYMSRMKADGSFGPGKVVRQVSTEFEDIMPNVRARPEGGYEMVFSSNRPTWGNGKPAKGQQDVYVSYSWWLTDWTAPRNLGDAVNTAGVEQRATLSADGHRLYFGRDGDIYVSTRSGRH